MAVQLSLTPSICLTFDLPISIYWSHIFFDVKQINVRENRQGNPEILATQDTRHKTQDEDTRHKTQDEDIRHKTQDEDTRHKTQDTRHKTK